MTRLLAIETATDVCSVAVTDGVHVTFRHEHAPRRHAALVLAQVREVLAEAGMDLAELDAIALGRGPGSFTGVRIAAAVVQGLALGADRPVVPLSTLAILAAGVHRRTGAVDVAVALDARMNELYFGAYRRDGDGAMMCVGKEQVGPPAALALPPGAWLLAGPGWSRYVDALPPAVRERVHDAEAGAEPDARDALGLARVALARGAGVPPEAAEPVYLRNRVTRSPAPARK